MPELHELLAREGAELLVDCVERLPDSLLNAKPQSDQNVSFGKSITHNRNRSRVNVSNSNSISAPKIDDSMTVIKWDEMSARHIFNLHRALYSFKSLKTSWQGRPIKLIELEEFEDSSIPFQSCEPGTVEYLKTQRCLRVLCADGRYLLIKKVQVQGKNVHTASDFNNGFLKKTACNDRKFE